MIIILTNEIIENLVIITFTGEITENNYNSY